MNNKIYRTHVNTFVKLIAYKCLKKKLFSNFCKPIRLFNFFEFEHTTSDERKQ